VPTIIKLGNIAIRMFANDHNPPHFHIVTADRQIAVALRDFSILAGSMERKNLDVALEWATKNKERLHDEWKRLNP
jgi:hypothetical protein